MMRFTRALNFGSALEAESSAVAGRFDLQGLEALLDGRSRIEFSFDGGEVNPYLVVQFFGVIDDGTGGSGIRLAELVAALSLTTDLGLGQPLEHVLRSSLIATRLAEAAGLDEEERAVVFYVSLLAFVGCSADSHETAAMFGDDIAIRAAIRDVDRVGVGFVARRIGRGSPPVRRALMVGSFVATGGRAMAEAMRGHCEVTGELALQLGLGPEVRDPLEQMFERWDGRGRPAGLRGDELAPAIRIVHIAGVVETFHHRDGVEGAIEVADARRGTQFDPALIDRFCRDAPMFLDGLGEVGTWDAVIDSQPGLRAVLSEQELDLALEAFADYADLKSPYTVGHSRGVAGLVADAARGSGLPEAEVTEVRRAALVHDIGALGVPSSIWDKPSPLSPAEWERVRLHPYLVERTLARPKQLASFAAVAALHHERLDGSGYPRGLAGPGLSPPARLLASADVCHAMSEPRPYRPALTRPEAERALRAEVLAGRLDGDAVNAVLAAAGHRVRRRAEQPAGLTRRELEVLGLLARGHTNRKMAERLGISAKTVGNHIEHIYTKLGTSTRAGACLFASRYGFVDDADVDG